MSRPESNARAALSGSNQMLNSAAGVTLPVPSEPPIIATRPSAPGSSGRSAASSAMFVSGPTGASSTGSSLRSRISASRSTACIGTTAALDSGTGAPPSPSVPCTTAASRPRGTTSGRAAPAATGTSSRPASASTRSALRVVVSSGRLPATVVRASNSTSGLASASRMAIASSTPGSQSMTSGMATGR